MCNELELKVGMKTDPILYRFSFEWLFQLLAQERIDDVQLGSFFELYHLPDKTLFDLKQLAETYGITIRSVFTAHRELGGFFVDDKAWQMIARRNYERLIDVAYHLGAKSVGSNPGAILRDKMHLKPLGISNYLSHMKELLHYAHEKKVNFLTIEPMSCAAEPPTFPDEVNLICGELADYHRRHPQTTSMVGCCVDTSHGYADRKEVVRWSNMQLIEAALPYITEMHLKNTCSTYNSTFGFTKAERVKGIVNVSEIRNFLLKNIHKLPVKSLIGYLEISGPKLGRDYSDYQLEQLLRESLRYLKQAFKSENVGDLG